MTLKAEHGARMSMEFMGFEVSVSSWKETEAGALDGMAWPARSSRRAGSARVLAGDGSSRVIREDAEAEVEALFDGEVISLALLAREPVLVERARISLRHAFASDERVLLNGYQSWTDTAERSPWARMRGLLGVPRSIVKRYALDSLGDYAFADYSSHRGIQHGFTYATFRRGGGMVLVASLDESRGFTTIGIDAATGTVTVEVEPPARPIKAGERVVLGRIAIVHGGLDECYDRWFQLARVTARPVKPLIGYTSWYRHYDDIDEAKLERDLAGMTEATGIVEEAMADDDVDAGEGAMDDAAIGVAAKAVEPGGADDGVKSGFTRLFQIDDGYCKVGDWLEYDVEKFPQGLEPLARRVRDAGFEPGLWIAPFVCERSSRVFREHDEWLLRDASGNLVPTGSHWSGAFALDTRNIDVRSYILNVLRTMTRTWGFTLLKMDFLYAACMLPHDGLNRGELMSDAMRLLRKGVGDDTLILGCGVPLASAFGIVDYCRIGCDVGLDWDDKPFMRALHRERVSTKNSLGNTRSRSPLDGRAFGNDPDVFFLRDDAKLTRRQRDELLFADARFGSALLTSDDMGAWTDDMRQRYGEAVRVFLGRERWI